MADNFEHGMVDLDSSHQSETKPPGTPSKPPQRVFRVTTLQGGDYESIPLQRLQNSFGTKSFGRSAVGALGILVGLSIVLFWIYMHAVEKLHDAEQSEFINDIDAGSYVLINPLLV